jgi:hypothetical protein
LIFPPSCKGYEEKRGKNVYLMDLMRLVSCLVKRMKASKDGVANDANSDMDVGESKTVPRMS